MSNAFQEFIPYGKHQVSEEDIDSVVDVLKHKFLTQGEHVPEFEYQLSTKVHAKYGVAVNSATSALHLACLSLGVGKGDTVWTVSTTFVASANCALYCDATIDFVDINYETGLMCIDHLALKLDQARLNNTIPKVIIPVHLAGKSCDLIKIRELADKYGFKIIEDASHALGSSYLDDMVGSCRFSDMTVFSFHPVKMITSGEGGMIVTNNPSYAKKAKELRSHGIVKENDKLLDKSKGDWYYEQHYLGYNFRLSDLQAALGLSQLKRLDHFVYERNILFERYKSMLHSSSLHLLDSGSTQGNTSSLHLAILMLPELNCHQYNKVFSFMRENKIGVQLHYLPVHLQPFYRNLGFKEGDFPNSEKYSHTALSIPLFVGLLESQQHRIVNTLKEVYSQLKFS